MKYIIIKYSIIILIIIAQWKKEQYGTMIFNGIMNNQNRNALLFNSHITW